MKFKLSSKNNSVSHWLGLVTGSDGNDPKEKNASGLKPLWN